MDRPLDRWKRSGAMSLGSLEEGTERGASSEG